MRYRLLAALTLLSLLAAGTADAQSQPPPEGNLPPLCDVSRYATSKPSDDEAPPSDHCPGDFPGDRTPGPTPTPRPDPFLPEPPPIREQN